MKRLMILGLVSCLSVTTLVGCGKKEEVASGTNQVTTQEESKEETKEEKRSSDEMYDLYTSKLNEVEKFFEDNNIDFKEDEINRNKKYDGTVSISYENSDDNEEYSIAGYGIAFEENGEISYITARLAMNVNDEEMKSKEFKFEETEFYKFKNILIPEIKNTDEINDKVNSTYKNLTSIDRIEIENGNIKEIFLLGDNTLVYDIIICP